ncbi:MAG: hypothetical protein FDZ75_09125 [Actinobacteria bacterium]|nr:MAG: hypothetical protein FDZ75_09125 [Actinomycetota bacterium]
MEPVVDGLEKQYTGKVEFKRYNVDNDAEGQKLMEQFKAQYVPTFVFVNADGTIANTLVGEVAETAMQAELNKLK